ncbi:hypothetical protein AXF42_Ash009269 [Apostasia shenzhenica]|uniref:Uncharacterized protein n=1 Tax=Apostasia shenzhenica TaxID=1088818 RepID=A0A2I0B3L1_9ASPA|nr:hypothetical protein AXF42_Ash009269 [Apostasia shenzhenica]
MRVPSYMRRSKGRQGSKALLCHLPPLCGHVWANRIVLGFLNNYQMESSDCYKFANASTKLRAKSLAVAEIVGLGAVAIALALDVKQSRVENVVLELGEEMSAC